MSKESYIVTLNRPEGVTVTQMKAYIQDAVSSLSLSFKPPGMDDEDPDGDPLFGKTECTVKRFHPKVKAGAS